MAEIPKYVLMRRIREERKKSGLTIMLTAYVKPENEETIRDFIESLGGECPGRKKKVVKS